MLDRALRPLKDQALLPVARLIGTRLSPAAVTVAGLAAGIACAALLYRRDYAAGLAFWILNRSLDGLDGLLARDTGRASDFGGYLDILLDFLVYAIVPLALALGRPSPITVLPALGILLATFYVNAASWMYLSALLEKRARGASARGEITSVATPPGLIEGAETMLFYSVLMVFPGILRVGFYGMAVTLAITIVQRMIWAAHHLSSPADDGNAAHG